MKIEYRHPGEITPYERNTKAHPADQVAKIATSIREFGFRQPILVDVDGVIIAGHGRHAAAVSLNLQEVPVVVATDLSTEKARALRIADNKVAESDWLEDVLQQELVDLGTAGLDLSFMGFESKELDLLLQLGEPGGGLTDPDDVPEPPQVPRCKTGDIWRLGPHRLICGDCTDPATVDTLMQGEQMDCMITDPPYNVDYGAKVRHLNKGRKGAKHKDIENDALSEADFERFLAAVFTNAARVLRPGGGAYVFYADSYGHTFRKTMTQAGILHKQTLIWVKNSAVMSRQDYHWRHEPCLYGWKAGAAHRWCGNRKQNTVLEDGRAVVVEQDPKGHGQIISFTDGVRTCQIRVPEYEVLFDGTDDMTTIWKVDRPTKNLDHPTMKPVEVVLRALRNSTKVGDKVTDFFLGSGTTLMGCEMLDRVCYGSEKDPVYCDVILRRWEEYTGRKAEKAQG